MNKPNLVPKTLKVALTLVATMTGQIGQAADQIIVASGLAQPTKLDATRGGNLIVSETGLEDNDGRLSIVDVSGVRPLLGGLPTGIDLTDGLMGPTAISVVGCCTVLIGIGEGDTLRNSVTPGEQVPNPVGNVSPLFSSVLKLFVKPSLDRVYGSFDLTRDDHERLADGEVVRLTSTYDETAFVVMAADIKDFRPDLVTNVRASQPFGFARSPKIGRIIADSGYNALLSLGRFGRTKVELRFDPVANPLPFGPPVSDYVPTAVRERWGSKSRFLVGNFVGFPFAPGTATVQEVDLRSGSNTTLISGLTSITDLLSLKSGIYVLEFTGNFLENQPGQLLHFADPNEPPRVLADNLIGPTGLSYVPAENAIYIAERFGGKITRVRIDEH